MNDNDSPGDAMGSDIAEGRVVDCVLELPAGGMHRSREKSLAER